MELDGKVAVVTGGASGIGAALTRRFAAAGAKVVVADRNVNAARLFADTKPPEAWNLRSETVQNAVLACAGGSGRLWTNQRVRLHPHRMTSYLRTIPLVLLTAVADPVLAEGDVEAGRKVAEQHCSRCHVIGDYNKYGGIGSTPSFQLLANSFPDYKDRFETFYARRPHPVFVIIEGYGRHMPELPPNAAPVKLPLRAVADVLAFVETLRKKR